MRKILAGAGLAVLLASGTLGLVATPVAAVAPRAGPGSGPTIVLEAGLGDGAEAWRPLRAVLPADLPVFAWSRAGYGGGMARELIGSGRLWPSDGDGRRTGAEVAAHLHQRLAEAHVPAPYVLVSHSIGASYALSFAKAYPAEVAGLVFVDPRLPGFTRRCEAEGMRLCQIPKWLTPLMSPAERVEIRGLEETDAALADLRAIRDIPVTILTAGRGAPGGAKMQALWEGYAAEFARGFTHAGVQVVQGSGHYMQRDQPRAIAAAILAMARASARPAPPS